MGRNPTETLMGEPKRVTIDSRRKAKKTPALRLTQVNVTDSAKNVTFRAELQDVEMNPANMEQPAPVKKAKLVYTENSRQRTTNMTATKIRM